MPDRTILHWEPVLQREQPRGSLDVTWRWKVVVGRAKDSDVSLKHPSIPLRHGQFTRLQNTWFVENFETAHGIFLHGKRITLEAVLGADVDFAMLVRFRFETIPMSAEETSFRDAVRAVPTDDSRFLVYADWLLEQDDELGKLMVSPAPIPARWLGPLLTDGIAVTWRHGFFESVKVVSAAGIVPTRDGVFYEVLAHPLSAFLLGLEVDTVLLNTESPGIPPDRWVDWLFQALLDSPPPTLRRLKVRMPRVADGLRFEAELKALKKKAPQLETPFERLFTEGALT